MDEEKYFKGIAEYKLLAKHEVGQNFLVDSSSSKRIVDLAEIAEGDRVLEIGSGAGSLSFFLAQHSASCDLIDIDEALVLKLKNDFAHQEHVHPLLGNIMRWDLSSYTKIVGNLPYYITSGIIERILLSASQAKIAVLMVEKDVVSRLNAPQGSADYGPLPILIRYRATLEKGFNVPRTSFSPAPHVDSSVFVLRFKDSVSADKSAALYELVSKLFLHRRKTILNNLQTIVNDADKAKSILEKCAIAPTRRPEELSLGEYLKLLSQLH